MKKILKNFRKDLLPWSMILNPSKKNAINLFHIQNIDTQHIFQIPGYDHEKCTIYKIRKFACKALKGSGARSGIRIIYAYHSAQLLIEFIEIYYKGDKENEDSDLIKKYLAQTT